MRDLLWLCLRRPLHTASKNDQSIASPDFITYDEFVARTLYSLETDKARVEGDQSEAKVIFEYHNLTHTARRHLQLELPSGIGPFTQGKRQHSNGSRALETPGNRYVPLGFSKMHRLNLITI